MRLFSLSIVVLSPTLDKRFLHGSELAYMVLMVLFQLYDSMVMLKVMSDCVIHVLRLLDQSFVPMARL